MLGTTFKKIIEGYEKTKVRYAFKMSIYNNSKGGGERKYNISKTFRAGLILMIQSC